MRCHHALVWAAAAFRTLLRPAGEIRRQVWPHRTGEAHVLRPTGALTLSGRRVLFQRNSALKEGTNSQVEAKAELMSSSMYLPAAPDPINHFRSGIHHACRPPGKCLRMHRNGGDRRVRCDRRTGIMSSGLDSKNIINAF